MRRLTATILALFSLLIITGCSQAADSAKTAEVVPGIPVKNTVTLVDVGATTCIPCRMMAPILEEVKKEYAGRAAVIFIDAFDQANAGKAKAFKVMTIPAQIFYDKQGREVFRHEGFFDKKSIIAKLDELLRQ